LDGYWSALYHFPDGAILTGRSLDKITCLYFLEQTDGNKIGMSRKMVVEKGFFVIVIWVSETASLFVKPCIHLDEGSNCFKLVFGNFLSL
jgi:hypothetical protein